jgi:glycosyltransferase involved in cell wall biosynthesis
VDFPEWGAEGYVHLLDRGSLDGVPVVIQLHGPLVMFAHALGWPDPRSAFFRLGTAMEGTCLERADAVYSSSRCSRRWCVEHYGLAPERIPVLHTGVDTRFFRANGAAKDGRPTVLFAGKIERNKGVEVLLDAACEVARAWPGLRLSLLGRGNAGLQHELAARAEARGLPGLLELGGHVGREELRARLARAHVFAAPSRYEGGPGFVYLEAMACSLPVIACSGSGASEVVLDGESGFLVPPEDREALVAALSRLLADDALRARMGANARRFVVAEADSELCLRRMDAFYRRVVEAGGRPC